MRVKCCNFAFKIKRLIIDKDYTIIDLSAISEEDAAKDVYNNQLCFKLNHTMPHTPEYDALVQELFGEFGEGSTIMPMINVVRGREVKIGRNCAILNNVLFMAAGGITIGDEARIAANAQLITNNHDEHKRWLLTCAPIEIKRNAWVGAGATILPGITIGENAIVVSPRLNIHPAHLSGARREHPNWLQRT